MITRDLIIKNIQQVLQGLPYVQALWLEGSDGLGCVDQYSDIDFVADVVDGYEEKLFTVVEDTLLQLGQLDLNNQQYVDHPKIMQKIYHIKETTEFLLIDFNIQSHSRNKDESTFIKGDIVEAAKVLFDKSNVVTFKDEDFDIRNIKNEIINKISEFQSRYQQHSRVIKYVKRNEYLEAYLYYMKYVVEPIVQLIRLKYTPKYADLYLIHISNHIPEEEKLLLEQFYKVKDLEAIYAMTIQSKTIFNNLVNDVLSLLEE